MRHDVAIFVAIDSAIGQGTTVRIYPPISEDPATRTDPTPAPTPGGHETILLVEDEDDVRDIVRQTLEASGYTVLEATDAEEAIGLADVHGPAVDLLLSDVVMPRIGGIQLADRLQERRPALPLLFMTGYSDEIRARYAARAGAVLLEKPFTRVELEQAVRRVLDATSPAR
jgi:two-component system, cell cycle sensor histidine kinase and response regulator CckA